MLGVVHIYDLDQTVKMSWTNLLGCTGGKVAYGTPSV